ncbi:MAG: hypothetical protein CBD88_07885 [Flavobacteriales bacterium TMED228]|nr:MAG: hypothetical protein CBD88_07885 [Flavobacteriales bacterium TMED228]|tara:strand:- start:1897 stop:2484 length:588 start_codon:yes stop_codon:yes gene_type:complete
MADLITLADYKEAEGLSTPKEDAKISALVPSVSQLVKTYCANTFVDFYSSNKTETFNIDWATYIVQLTESPVNSIISVKERADYGSSYATLTTAAYEYFLDTETDSIFRTTSAGYKNWAKGVGAVEVVYRAGYSAVPSDLKLAVIDLITYYLKDEHKERRVLSGASIQNQATSSQRGNVAFPDHIKRVLDLYKIY